MTTVADVDPPELVAVTLYVAWAVTSMGVPEITPVAGSRERPGGSAGATE
jgi:hypothetical protein